MDVEKERGLWGPGVVGVKILKVDKIDYYVVGEDKAVG